MKTSTVLSRSLLLVALLVVCLAAAAPLPADPDKSISEKWMMDYFKKHPDAAQDLFPELLSKATSIDLKVEDDVLADLIEKKTDQDLEYELQTDEDLEDELQTDQDLEDELQTDQDLEDEEAYHGRMKRSVYFNFSHATLGSGFNFESIGTLNDSSHKDRSQHDSNNWSDSSHKDWSTHDSSHKDWSQHDSSHKDWNTHDSARKDWKNHDSSHKDWSEGDVDESCKDCSQGLSTLNSDKFIAVFGWGK